MRTHLILPGMLIICSALLFGCSSSDVPLAERVDNTIVTFQREDPEIQRFFDSARGYAVFPTVAKGGLGVGGAYGEGELFEDGARVGKCSLSQGTIGFQAGGQAYSELIFFETKEAVDDFKNETFAFAAQASAVAAKAGASADADYADGVVVFTKPKTGLMYEASIGGQKFDFEAYDEETIED